MPYKPAREVQPGEMLVTSRIRSLYDPHSRIEVVATVTSVSRSGDRIRIDTENGDIHTFLPAEPVHVEPSQPPARYVCKECGAESPAGIGYVLSPGAEPLRSSPAPGCPNPHLTMPTT